MKSGHHLVYHSSILTILSLFAISLGLLYYAEIEQAYIAHAQTLISPRQYLKYRADEMNLNYTLLERIVHCESSWKMVQNKKSSAYGYFQILDRTEASTPQYKEGLRKFDPYANIDMGIYLFDRYGWQPWTESRPCWYWYQ